MIVDNGGDGGHKSQSCRHVQVQVQGQAEPAKCQIGVVSLKLFEEFKFLGLIFYDGRVVRV